MIFKTAIWIGFPLAIVGAAALAWAAPPFVLRSEQIEMPTVANDGADSEIQIRTLPSRGALADYDQRPLFSPNRRPPVQEEEVRLIPPPTFDVVGVTISGSRGVAVLQLANNTQMRARVGDEVEGWSVANIGKTGVSMQHGADVVEVKIRRLGE